MNDTLTCIEGLRVGHWTDAVGLTGVTVVLCEAGVVGGVDQRGGAPGTRETDLLRPMHLVQEVHAVVLAGGSAFGLAAADGVMHYLAQRGAGFPTRQRRVPIVPAAVLYDLDLGDPLAFPEAEAGSVACLLATTDPVVQGNHGAGMGCSVGKMRGPAFATKAGIGSASAHGVGGLKVAALVAVNALGDVLDERGDILVGARTEQGGWANTMTLLQADPLPADGAPFGATVIGVVATNARLHKEQANHVALMAQDGLARAVRPAHTEWDGDTLFVLATGEVAASTTVVGALAAEAVAGAIRAGVRAASSAGGLPCASAWHV